MLYTIKAVDGELLPKWIEESVSQIDWGLGQHTPEDLVRRGLARKEGIALKVDIVKVKLVEIEGQ
jgi:hypothetical protein